jgi:hypothetical protein
VTPPSAVEVLKLLPTRSSSTTARAPSPSMASRFPTLASSTAPAETARTLCPAALSSRTSRPTTARFLRVSTPTSGMCQNSCYIWGKANLRLVELLPSLVLALPASRLSVRSSRELLLATSPSPFLRVPPTTASTLLPPSRLARRFCNVASGYRGWYRRSDQKLPFGKMMIHAMHRWL